MKRRAWRGGTPLLRGARLGPARPARAGLALSSAGPRKRFKGNRLAPLDEGRFCPTGPAEVPRRATPSQGPRPTPSAAFARRYGQATPFQRRVYEAVGRIPKGQVRTYAEVARMIGQPKAARAVGQALKRNRWAPLIPCHRVIGSNGTLGGYSAPGGLSRKRQLLRREGAMLYIR